MDPHGGPSAQEGGEIQRPAVSSCLLQFWPPVLWGRLVVDLRATLQLPPFLLILPAQPQIHRPFRAFQRVHYGVCVASS